MAVEAFMRVNGLSDSTIHAGEQYVMPSGADYDASTGEMGQTALNQDNARIAGNRTDQNLSPLPDVSADLEVDVNLDFLHPNGPGSRAESLQMMDHGLMDAQRQEQLKNIAPIMGPINDWWEGVKERGSLLVADPLEAAAQGFFNTYSFNDQITEEKALQALNRAQEGSGNLDQEALNELAGSLPLSGFAGITKRVFNKAPDTIKLSQVKTLREIGVAKENRRAFFNGQIVDFSFPTKGGDDVVGFLQRTPNGEVQLTSQLFSINNTAGGAPAAFRKYLRNSTDLAKSLGATKIEIQGGSLINPDLAKALTDRGFTPKTVPVPEALGGGTQEVLSKIIDLTKKK
jgi:hypothetical protein